MSTLGSGQHAGLYFQHLAARPSAGTVLPNPLLVERPPVLILPGLLSDGRQCKRMARELTSHQRQVLLVDPLGSGRSLTPQDPSEYLLPRQAQRLLQLLKRLELPVVDVVGLSMGGMWAQHALLQAPQQFRHAVLVGTAASIEPRLHELLLRLRAQWQANAPFLELWRVLELCFFSAAFLQRPGVLAMLETLAMREPPSQAVALGQLDALLQHDLSNELHAVPHVRLVLAGEADFLMPPETQTRLTQALGYGQPSLVAGAGHTLWIEQPDALAQSLLQTL